MENGPKLLRHYTVSGSTLCTYYCKYIIIRPATYIYTDEKKRKLFAFHPFLSESTLHAVRVKVAALRCTTHGYNILYYFCSVVLDLNLRSRGSRVFAGIIWRVYTVKPPRHCTKHFGYIYIFFFPPSFPSIRFFLLVLYIRHVRCVLCYTH